jgi:hypothetical protein
MADNQNNENLVLKMKIKDLVILEDMLSEFPIRYQPQVNSILQYMNQFVTEESTNSNEPDNN